ncbi:hypothetical protein L195_g064600, partial [Trifolium pratense]
IAAVRLALYVKNIVSFKTVDLTWTLGGMEMLSNGLEE